MKKGDGILKKNNCVFSFLVKLSPAILLIIGLILNFKVVLDEKYNIDVADIIISLLPMIFTIITITLSLPSERIFGVSCIDFRKIRGKYSFSFLEMIIFTIVIFSLHFIFSICGMTIVIWSLNIISICYSIWFVAQEVPLLTRSNKAMLRIVKNAWKNKNYSDFKYGNNSTDIILNDVIKNVIITSGVVSAFNSFKTKKAQKNKTILESILSYNNDILFECSDIIECLSTSGNLEYKRIDIITMVDMSLNNISTTLALNDDFDVVDILQSSDKYYHITRTVFCLKEITDVLNLQEKFNKGICDSLHLIFMKLNYSEPFKKEIDWYFNILNTLLIYSISSDDLWFIRLLRNSNFNSLFSVYDSGTCLSICKR